MTHRPMIFVGIDSSWRESGALDWALREARFRTEPIRAIHVVDALLPAGPHFAPGADQAAKKLVADVAVYVADHDGPAGCTTDVLTGRPASTLAKAAVGVSMLVVGRRGAGTLARLLIGSTAEAITHEAETPVVVVPDRWQPSEEGSPVVVGVDEAEESDAAIAFAATAATERKVPLRMVRCWQPPNIYGAAPMTDLYEAWYQESKHGLEAAAEIWRHKYPGLEIHSDIRRGHAVGGLIAAAEESTAELLVLGGRSHRRLAPMLLLGSTARGVLHHAPCPIAVVHEPRDRR